MYLAHFRFFLRLAALTNLGPSFSKKYFILQYNDSEVEIVGKIFFLRKMAVGSNSVGRKKFFHLSLRPWRDCLFQYYWLL